MKTWDCNAMSCALPSCSQGVTVHHATAGEIFRRSGLVISREQGSRYDAGFALPVMIS